jgi:acyl CoA:acetate/3-ketoacid CoA transferase alpha subunit
MNKVVHTPAEAVAGIADGASLAVGGFGLCGLPSALIEAVLHNGASDLRVVSNNCGSTMRPRLLLSAGASRT